MNEDPNISLSSDDPLDRILAEYLQAADAGMPPDQQAFIARYPRFAAELREFFASQEQFEGVARPFRFEALPADEGSEPAAAHASNLVGSASRTVASVAGESVRGADPTQKAHGELGRPAVADETPPSSRIRYFGEYELLEEIARGGMGVVFRARQVRLNRIVALKMILAGQFASAEDVKRFQVEAENAAHLDHPNIVPIYEVGKHKGQHYFTMKLVEGGSLATQIAAFNTNPRAAATLLATVARAVHHAHQRGVLHRDLKPGNILVGADGQPQVTDFGLARQLEGDTGITVSGAVLGSPRYMAPEQARGEKAVTTAADVYGLGAVLYELLTGSPPFAADTALETLRLVKETEPRRPSAIRPRIDRDLETICLKCLAKDPEQRYASAEALADDLRRWLAGETILARRTSWPGRLRRWCRRRPAVAALTAISGVAAVLLVAVAVAIPYQRRLRQAVVRTEQARVAEEGLRKKVQQAYVEVDRANRIAEDALARSRTFDYLTHIAWSERESAMKNPAGAEQILEECPKDLRRWEWYHLKQVCRTQQLSIEQATGVIGIAAGPNNREIVTVGADGRLSAWDASTGLSEPRRQSRLQGLTGVTAAAFSAGGKLAVGFQSGQVDVLDESNLMGARLPPRQLRGAGPAATCLAFSPDGTHLAAGAGKTVTVWDAITGSLFATFEGHTEQVNGVCFSFTGSRLASCSGDPPELYATGRVRTAARAGKIKIWSLDRTKVDKSFGGRDGVISAVVFTAEDYVASAHDDGNIRLWRPDGRPELTLTGHVGPVLALAASPGTDFSASPAFLASAGEDQTVRVWDALTGRPTRVFRGHNGRVPAVAYLPATGQLASASSDRTVKVWDAAGSGEPQARVLDIARVGSRGSDVTFSADGGRVAVSCGSMLAAWDIVTGRELWHVDAGGNRVAFSPDGSWLAIAGGSTPAIIDAATGKTLKELRTPTPEPPNNYGVAISPDGRYVTEADTVWEVATGKVVQTLKQDGLKRIWDSAFSPDGRLLVTAGGDFVAWGAGQVKLWDWRAGKVVRTLQGPRVCAYAVVFSPDGSRVAFGGGSYMGTTKPGGGQYAGIPGEVKVWETATGRELFTFDRTDCVFRLAFSPDGSRLASAGGRASNASTPAPVTLWDLSVGKEVLELNGHTGGIYGLAFSRDGQLFVSADSSGSVRLWDSPGISLGGLSEWKPDSGAESPLAVPRPTGERPAVGGPRDGGKPDSRPSASSALGDRFSGMRPSQAKDSPLYERKVP